MREAASIFALLEVFFFLFEESQKFLTRWVPADKATGDLQLGTVRALKLLTLTQAYDFTVNAVVKREKGKEKEKQDWTTPRTRPRGCWRALWRPSTRS